MKECTYPDFIEKGMAAFNRMREQVDRYLWRYPDRVYLDGIRVRRALWEQPSTALKSDSHSI